MGLAVGDAIGTTLEFQAPETFEPISDMVGGGPFGLPAGAWTDDTSMALCLAESLVEKREFDPLDQLERYVRWHEHGYLSSTGRCFDIGGATRAALRRFSGTGEPFPGDAARDAAGNGPLMKLAPVPLAFAARPELALRHAAESARTTHGAAQAIDSARYLAALIVGAIDGVRKEELLGDPPYELAQVTWASEPLHREVAEVAAGSYRAKDPPEIRGTGYIVMTLEAALWALSRSASYKEGVLLAVNLGDDADTTGAVFGQLAGALYGVDGIPSRWRERVVMADRIIELADQLLELSEELARDAASAQ